MPYPFACELDMDVDHCSRWIWCLHNSRCYVDANTHTHTHLATTSMLYPDNSAISLFCETGSHALHPWRRRWALSCPLLVGWSPFSSTAYLPKEREGDGSGMEREWAVSGVDISCLLCCTMSSTDRLYMTIWSCIRSWDEADADSPIHMHTVVSCVRMLVSGCFWSFRTVVTGAKHPWTRLSLGTGPWKGLLHEL